MLKQKDRIYEGDWEVLIILDACRFDVFSNLFSRYDPEPVVSSGSCTVEWFYKTFDTSLRDTVYISGNPYIRKGITESCGVRFNASKYFKLVIDGWELAWRKVHGVYTTDPALINALVKTRLRLHRNERLIIHYMQPHAPYIPCADTVLSRWWCNDKGAPDFRMWEALQRNIVSVNLARKCYEANLKYVMTYVESLLKYLKGRKVVISADHGECFGEGGLWNHPCGSNDFRLRIVPWVEVTP